MARKTKQENMTAIRYMVSSDFFNSHNEWWFDTEEAARKKSRAARHAGHEVGCEDAGCEKRQDMMRHDRPENAGKGHYFDFREKTV